MNCISLVLRPPVVGFSQKITRPKCSDSWQLFTTFPNLISRHAAPPKPYAFFSHTHTTKKQQITPLQKDPTQQELRTGVARRRHTTTTTSQPRIPDPRGHILTTTTDNEDDDERATDAGPTGAHTDDNDDDTTTRATDAGPAY